MAQYRTKPVLIEAEQWWPGKAGLGVEVLTLSPEHPNISVARIRTLEGVHQVSPGDWIITGIAGEKYPCKPDIFELTYELV